MQRPSRLAHESADDFVAGQWVQPTERFIENQQFRAKTAARKPRSSSCAYRARRRCSAARRTAPADFEAPLPIRIAGP